MKLQKKLMVIPIRSQYEQQCNAAALEQLGITRLDRLDDGFTDHFENWTASTVKMNYDHSTETIVENVMKLAIRKINEKTHDELIMPSFLADLI